MSDMAPEPATGGGGGNPLTKKFGGIPGYVILGGALIIGYLFLRGKSSSSSASPSSSGGGGTSTTGNITINPATTSINVQGAQTPMQIVKHAPPPRHRVPNPQPKPPVVPVPPKVSIPVKHPAKGKQHPASPQTTSVTVAKWPGTSVNGLAQWNTTVWGIANHYHTTVAAVMKLNPQIKNANLIYPGQKITVPTSG